MLRSLPWLVLVSIAMVANGATLSNKKIGGSGPIDRSTALTSYWCYSAWQCNAFDTFVADGDSALVVLTVRNWDKHDPSRATNIRIDNFWVSERTAHDAYLTPVGNLANTNLFCAANENAELLDIDALPGASVAYSTRFSGVIGAEWINDAGQLVYVSGGAYEDPLDPGPLSTGAMRIGNGTGPEFTTTELQLTGLTAGVEYAISYWAAMQAEDNGLTNEDCQDPNDDLEVEIFGEEIVCTPDLPLIEFEGLRTLAYNPATNVWRFQAIVQNPGDGPAEDLGATITASSGHFTVTQATAIYGDMPANSGPHYIGPFEAIVNSTGPESWMRFSFGYANDCGARSGTLLLEGVSTDPFSYPTPSPSPTAPAMLAQNHPNPFNPRTTIEFSLPSGGPVELQIFDVRGRMIRRLLSETLPAGEHDVVWDGRDAERKIAAAGTYYYRLRTDGGEQIRKMVLLK